MEAFTKKRIGEEFRTSIIYTVRGFWREAVRVDQHIDLIKSHGEIAIWGAPDIGRTLGGSDGKNSITKFEREACFAAALLDAVKEAKRLDKRTGKPIKAAKRKI